MSLIWRKEGYFILFNTEDDFIQIVTGLPLFVENTIYRTTHVFISNAFYLHVIIGWPWARQQCSKSEFSIFPRWIFSPPRNPRIFRISLSSRIPPHRHFPFRGHDLRTPPGSAGRPYGHGMCSSSMVLSGSHPDPSKLVPPRMLAHTRP